MAGRGNGPAQLLVVGANHRSSTVVLRDEIYVDDREMPSLLAHLNKIGVHQALVLSTCDRVEVQAAASDVDAAAREIAGFLAARAGPEGAEMSEQFYIHFGDQAARQIFAVAASLDSQIIGEPQVLGQVKASHRLSKAAGMIGPELEAALQAAYGVAKQVRQQTTIGERPVSMAAAAVQIARDIHGDLSNAAAILIGDGEMGEIVVEQLRASGLGRLMTSAPTSARAEATARRLDCHLVPYDTFAAALPECDIIVISLGARQYAVTAEMIEGALKRRRRQPIFIVDGGVPGDVEPAVERLDEAFLFGLDDLERVAFEGRASREAVADEAWAILDRGLEEFLRGRAERQAVPAIAALREHFEAVRREVLEANASAGSEEVSRRLINRLLHEPSKLLRDGAASDNQEAERAVRRLFGLGRAKSKPCGGNKGVQEK
ncbi:MAG: glutamyl-tRNA reductase [Alphaproteobacteria bacterium]|nr:glutamyl-tRNA reductase [Alphaproteobacteria bacterium]